MNITRSAILSVVALSLGVAFGVGSQEGQAAKACKNIPKTPGRKCIETGDLGKGVVKTNRLRGGAVTGSKLGDGAVTDSKLSDGAVTDSKLSDGAVTDSKLSDGAVTDSKLSQSLQDHIGERHSFYETLELDMEERTIAQHGPLEYFVRCRVNDTFVDRVQIFATSSQGPWYEDNESLMERLPFAEVLALSHSWSTGQKNFSSHIHQHSMIGPDGHYMAIDGEAIGLGLNLYGHRCTAVGNAMKVKNTNGN